jgi:hypothetical protein
LISRAVKALAQSVANVTDGDFAALKLLQNLVGKHLGNHSELFDCRKIAVFIYGDTRAYLAAVLQSVKRVVSDSDGVEVVVIIYTENSALVVRLVKALVYVNVFCH